jgi:hypothetical protein
VGPSQEKPRRGRARKRRRRPGFLHSAPHLGLRSPRFFRLVSNLVILSSRNPSPVLLFYLAMSSCPLSFSQIVAFPAIDGKTPPEGDQRGSWLGDKQAHPRRHLALLAYGITIESRSFEDGTTFSAVAPSWRGSRGLRLSIVRAG